MQNSQLLKSNHASAITGAVPCSAFCGSNYDNPEKMEPKNIEYGLTNVELITSQICGSNYDKLEKKESQNIEYGLMNAELPTSQI